MRTFIIRVSIYALLVIAIVFSLFTFLPRVEDDYMNTYTRKCEMLEKVESPRIIFMGGSYVPYGLDSKRISDSLHINVVDAGLTHNMGLKYQLDDVASYLRKGDILVFIPDCAHFYKGFYGTPETLLNLCYQSHWRKIKLLNTKQITGLIEGVPSFFRLFLGQQLFSNQKLQNNKSPFNEYGDYTYHLDRPSLSHIKDFSNFVGPIDNEAVDYFAFKIKDLEKKYKVVILPCPMKESTFRIREKKINDVIDSLQLKGVGFSLAPKDCVVDDSCLFDAPMHLNKKGKDIYTGKILDVLCCIQVN